MHDRFKLLLQSNSGLSAALSYSRSRPPLNLVPLFDSLDDAQAAALMRGGSRVSFGPKVGHIGSFLLVVGPGFLPVGGGARVTMICMLGLDRTAGQGALTGMAAALWISSFLLSATVHACDREVRQTCTLCSSVHQCWRRQADCGPPPWAPAVLALPVLQLVCAVCTSQQSPASASL
jgi:hypothetical protein